MFIKLLILAFGFFLLISGANFLIKGSSNIAKKFNISEFLIGLTIVSLGTSLPELIITIISSATKNTELVFGNVIGSNVCNILFILGTISILKPIKFEKITITKNLPLLFLVTLIILFFGITNNLIINKPHGMFLLLIFLLYFIFSALQSIRNLNFNNSNNNTLKRKNDSSLINNTIYIIIGIVFLKYGGDFTVNSATDIAYIFNISERVVGFTILALGTSLPELVTSIIAIFKGDSEIAEGNIIGSCIINLCLILGVGAFISDIPLLEIYIEDIILLLFSIFLVWLYAFGNKNNILTRNNGIVLIIIYLLHFINLFI